MNVGETQQFNYTGGVQSFTAPYSGIYKLEVYGGQGQYQDGYSGKGGYSVGYVSLNKGQVLYVVVGGGGGNTYNGGGSGWTESIYVGSNTGWIHFAAGAGGGATHIATTNRGVLSDYSSYKSEVLIVAGGGGGGAGNVVTAGTGGGTSGTAAERSKDYSYVTSIAGTQSSGYAFGSGYESGGGGWYGGRYSGGGSGYIGGVTSYNGNNPSMTNGANGVNGHAKITLMKKKSVKIGDADYTVYVGSTEIDSIYIGGTEL